VKTISFVKSLVPYGLLIILLIAGKFLLSSITIPIFGGVKYTYGLFNPGWVFILAALPVVIFWHGKKSLVRPAIVSALKRTIEPFLVIAFLAAMVQIMINSGQNFSGIPSSLDYLARGVTSFLLPFWAPIIGAFGSFITGSATVSNVMFGDLLSVAGQTLHMDSAKILALALVGGAAGNMVALADILAATTVVGIKNEEYKVLKTVFPYCAIYVLLAWMVGLLIIL
jgi:lactate permease